MATRSSQPVPLLESVPVKSKDFSFEGDFSHLEPKKVNPNTKYLYKWRKTHREKYNALQREYMRKRRARKDP